MEIKRVLWIWAFFVFFSACSSNAPSASSPSLSKMLDDSSFLLGSRLEKTFISSLALYTPQVSEIKKDAVEEEGEDFILWKISYGSDGYRVEGLMAEAKNAPPVFPTILICHGYYNPKGYFTGQGTRETVKLLAKAGFRVLMTDYRGFGKSEGHHRMDDAVETKDVINAAWLLKKMPSTGKMAVIGYSWGCGFALAAVEAKRDWFSGLALYYPQAGGVIPSGQWMKYWLDHGFSVSDAERAFREASPLYHLEMLQTPIALFQGLKDSYGIRIQYQALQNGLKKLGASVESHEYPEYGHAFGDVPTNHSWSNLIKFLKKNIE